MADLSDDELNAASQRIGQLLSAALTCDHPAMLDWARIAFALRERAAPSVGAEGLPPLPEPAREVVYNGSKGYTFEAYTVHQMRAYALAALASRPAVDADKRDAERWRALRSGEHLQFSVLLALTDPPPVVSASDGWEEIEGDDLDAAIDAARTGAG